MPLLDSPDQLAAVIGSSSEAVVACDLDGRVGVWNDAAERLYGYRRPEIVGLPMTALLAPDRRQEHDEVVERVLAGERVEHYETEHVARTGDRVEVSISVSAIRGRDGTIYGISTFARDVGERRHIERELAATRLQLERYAAELRRSNEELEQFAYVASHDLSEPLRVISGMLQLLGEEYADRFDEQGRDYVDRSVRAAARLRRLISDLLAYSRISRAPLAVVPVSLQQIAADVIADLEATQPDARGAVTATGLPLVCGDPGLLRRVLENLIGNGLKFNDSASPEVGLSARRDAGGWTLFVDDNGIGVPPEHAARIFEVFKRLHTRDAYEGSGIGLAVCARVVERHGGEIRAEPRDGRGSRFSFTLPDGEKPA